MISEFRAINRINRELQITKLKCRAYKAMVIALVAANVSYAVFQYLN